MADARAPIETLYGTFAFVPSFRMWTHVALWLTPLGAVSAETLPRSHTTRIADHQRAGNDLVTAVALLHALYEARTRSADQGKVAVEELTRSCDVEWFLTCDPKTTDLGAILARLALDPSNSLITGDQEMLGPWADAAFESEWMRRPLAEFSSPKPEVAGFEGRGSASLSRLPSGRSLSRFPARLRRGQIVPVPRQVVTAMAPAIPGREDRVAARPVDLGLGARQTPRSDREPQLAT